MKRIIMNANTDEKRVALIEEGQVVEWMIDSPDTSPLVGNIYKGRVVNILPGMQAAFVDIGLQKNAYLPLNELLAWQWISQEDPDQKRRAKIQSFLTEGQEVFVQVTKEPTGSKGAKLTEVIELPGKYLVYLPKANYVAVSRRIEDEKRGELRKFANNERQLDEGVIIRTEAAKISPTYLQNDWSFLRRRWERIVEYSKQLRTPTKIHHGSSMIDRLIRQSFIDSETEVITDDRVVYHTLNDYLSYTDDLSPSQLSLYQGYDDIFSHYELKQVLQQTLLSRVELLNGGYIDIEKTEAMTVIDVNTGTFVGKDTHEETMRNMNIQAAKTIATEIRKRSIGGIVLIDFIDMKQERSQSDVLRALEHSFRDDPMRVKIQGFTKLGLVEMTRKKAYHEVSELLTEPCTTCQGSGRVLGKSSQMYELERLLYEFQGNDAEALIVEVPSFIADKWLENHAQKLTDIEAVISKTIYLIKRTNTEKGEVRFVGKKEHAKARWQRLLIEYNS
ncbi:Rne/Rng family ribonuclease [Texcoconibacillus texcoconensis]|uniref:Ribonuclease G n=1 Tax=Texcoconibacillus texcoconensis TaxID=1095777 RepID=A0A840QSQ4_9BACI|nr:ribonuclease G [Texcoconibacillus texcoconensis]